MPILDAKTVFANSEDIHGGTTTVIKGETVWNGAIATDNSQIVDQVKAGDAVGQELTVKVVVGGTAAISGGTASTLTVKLQTAATLSSPVTDGDFEDLLISPALKVNGVIPGTEIYSFRIPAGTKRYLRTTIAVGGASISTGVVSIYATRDL